MSHIAGPHLSAKDAAVYAFAERDRLKTINNDLLAALENLMGCHESYCALHGPGMDSKNAICMKPARAAIAKAKESTP